MTPKEATFILAHHLVWLAIMDATFDTSDIWKGSPALSEGDMVDIVNEMRDAAAPHWMTREQIEAATAVLAARAGEPS